MMRTAIIALCAFLAACDEKEIPIWRGKIYVGNSLAFGVQRKQDNETIYADDPKFDTLLCITQKDFDCWFETYVINCERWEKQSPCGLENSQP